MSDLMFFIVLNLIFGFWIFLGAFLYPHFLNFIWKYNSISSDSKDFKIDDPVVYNDHGDDFFTYINGVYSWEEKLCYSLEAVEFVVWSSWLRHPTKEELEKYFRK